MYLPVNNAYQGPTAWPKEKPFIDLFVPIKSQPETSSSMHYEISYFAKESPKQVHHILGISQGEYWCLQSTTPTIPKMGVCGRQCKADKTFL